MRRSYYITDQEIPKMIRLAKKLFRKKVSNGNLTDAKSVHVGFWKDLWGSKCISYDDLSCSYDPKYLGRVILKNATVKRIEKP